MDNKKLYKRVATCFWFLLATCPIWLTTIQFIFAYLLHTDSLSITDIQTYLSSVNFNSYLSTNSAIFENYTPSFLTDMWTDLFTNIGGITSNLFAYCFAWFTWVYFVHILLDVATWLPKLFHSWLDRWC